MKWFVMVILNFERFSVRRRCTYKVPSVPHRPVDSMLSTSLLTAVAGGCSGMAVDFLLYPLDTIKTRRQARNRGLPLPSAASFYRGTMDDA